MGLNLPHHLVSYKQVAGADPGIKLTAAQHRKHLSKGVAQSWLVATPSFVSIIHIFQLFTLFASLSVVLS